MSTLNFTISIPEGLNSKFAALSQPAPATTYAPVYDKFKFTYMLCNRLHSENYNGELKSINHCLDDKKIAVRISYSGARELVSSVDDDEYQVPIALDTVARRVINATDNKNDEPVNIENENFRKEAINARKEIFKKLKNYYTISDAQLKKCSFIVRIFNSVRETFNSSFFVRHTINQGS